jgi:hypothetical protein
VNITVVIPAPLWPAFDGRDTVSLGLPARADIGDILQALFALYPRLRTHLAGEGPQAGLQLQVVLPDEASSGAPLREGQRVYLTAEQPTRLGKGVPGKS